MIARKKIEDRGKQAVTEETDHAEIVSVATTKQQILNASTPPCAACRLLRRRCVLQCPFSPYFSPDEPQKFAAIHKVFGASNVSKMLMEVPEEQRGEAANSLVYEANIRLRDPVYGCMGAIIVLQKQVEELETELRAMKEELLKHSYSQSNSATMMSPYGGATAAQWPQLPEFLASSSSMVMNSQWQQNQNIR